MTAICKTIDIHGGLSHLLDYGADENKTSMKNNDLQNALDYAKNPLKTILDLDDGDRSMLVTGILCTPETAEEEFALVREKYHELNGSEYSSPFIYKDKKTGSSRVVQKEPVTAVHLIQSFSEDDLDPRTVHQIGIDLCELMGWQAVVDTHLNTGHFHNHIIINAYMPGGERKVSMDKRMLINIRQQSDDIQREYGLDIAFMEPDLQLQRSERSLNYREWEMQKKNLSWKDQIRADMIAARHVSDTREEFIAVMGSYGYMIERQTDDNILWWNRQHTKKIWDRTLGDGFAIDHFLTAAEKFDNPSCDIPMEPASFVIPNDREESSLQPTGSERDRQHHTQPISTTRYAWNGRRRSDLELLIRKAISIVQKVKAFYERANTSYDYRPTQKLASLQTALETIEKLDIHSDDTLRDRMHDTGARLNHIKSEIRAHEAQNAYYSEITRLIAEYEAAKAVYDSVRYWKQPHKGLHTLTYTPDEIRQCRADISPITPCQKRELYLAMKKHPEYRIKDAQKGYANISSVEAQEILRFFKGKCDRPDILLHADEAFYQRMYGDPSPENQENVASTRAFQKDISCETPRKQAVLTQLRNRSNALLALGIDPANLDGTKDKIADFNDYYLALCREKAELAQDYKRLIRLQQQICFAESEPYLYGPLLRDPQRETPQPDKEQDKSHEIKGRDRSDHYPNYSDFDIARPSRQRRDWKDPNLDPDF